MAEARRITLANTDHIDLGPAMEGAEGYWLVQITAITAGVTVTPQGSLDGATFVARKFSPIDGSADVASATAAGLWKVKGSCPLRLQGGGTAGTATIYAVPILGS